MRNLDLHQEAARGISLGTDRVEVEGHFCARKSEVVFADAFPGKSFAELGLQIGRVETHGYMVCPPSIITQLHAFGRLDCYFQIRPGYDSNLMAMRIRILEEKAQKLFGVGGEDEQALYHLPRTFTAPL